MKNSKSFIQTYKWAILVLVLLELVGFIAVYLAFAGNGFIPTGTYLEKKDWLAFAGGYLSFAGTLLISVITAMQTTYYNNRENSKQTQERINAIRPIFAISFPDSSEESHVFTLSISNVGAYPVSNVIMNGHYLYQLLVPAKEKKVMFSYSSDTYYRLLVSEYEKSENGYPKNIIINYEDIDGNNCFQIFEMKLFEGTYYYSLEEINAL